MLVCTLGIVFLFLAGNKPDVSLHARCSFIYHTRRTDLYTSTLNRGIYLPVKRWSSSYSFFSGVKHAGFLWELSLISIGVRCSSLQFLFIWTRTNKNVLAWIFLKHMLSLSVSKIQKGCFVCYCSRFFFLDLRDWKGNDSGTVLWNNNRTTLENVMFRVLLTVWKCKLRHLLWSLGWWSAPISFA